MLLKVNTRTLDYQTVLDVWEIGGKHHLLKRPFDPYFYSPYRLSAGTTAEIVRKRLSTLKEEKMFKVEFPNTRILSNSRVEGGMEDCVPYDQRVAIDVGFKHKSPPPMHDAFDLEMDTSRGVFPDPAFDGITAVSYVGEGFKDCKTIHDEPEYELISWLIDQIKRRNPDTIDTYFGSFADWGWLLIRSHKLGIPLLVGRDRSEPFIITRTYKSGKKTGEDKIVEMGGRVHFDVWKEVNADQTIFGIKNKQLKTVAKWFGFSVIEVDRSQISKLPPEELRAYCLSDAWLTHELAKIYIRNLIPLGEYLELPFNMVVERNPSHPSNYVLMRRLGKLGIVADKSNAERYPQFVKEGRKAYQGALINLYRAGLIRNIRKLDFKSMYPSVTVCYNYSPENIFDVHIHSGESLPKWVDIKGNKISVYDQYLGIITVKVDLSKDSVTRELMKEWMQWRARIRADKTLAKVEMESQQWAVKVLMNANTGYHGMQWASCGCYPIVAHITGHGRYWIDESTDFLVQQKEHPIERDTDGIYYDGETDYSQQITDLIQSLIPKQFDRSVIKVESETYDAGIFYDEKGYVLRKKDGKLMFHGSGLKGRHLPNICDKALEATAINVFESTNVLDALNDFGRTVKDYSQSDFVMTVALKKPPEQYSSKNQYGKLIQKCKAYGLSVRWGDELQYLKTNEYGFLPLGTASRFTIDHKYYLQRIAKVLERILQITHGYNSKQIVQCLKGARVNPQKKYEVRTF